MLRGAIRKFEYRAILLDDDAKDFLDNVEMKNVLAGTATLIGGKLDLLGMDACLMSMAEVGYQIRGSASFTVGSEQTEPGDGWPYDRILTARMRVQAYEVPDNVDLVDFCRLLAAAAPGTALAARCRDVGRAVGAGAGGAGAGYVVAQGSKGSDLADSHGVAIYFPTMAVSPLYGRLDWCEATGWDRFLRAFLAAVRGR